MADSPGSVPSASSVMKRRRRAEFLARRNRPAKEGLAMLAKIEACRLEGLQLLAEGRELGFPFALSHFAVKNMMRKRGIVVPDDILAFLSEGKVSDSQVRDWHSPVGG